MILTAQRMDEAHFWMTLKIDPGKMINTGPGRAS